MDYKCLHDYMITVPCMYIDFENPTLGDSVKAQSRGPVLYIIKPYGR